MYTEKNYSPEEINNFDKSRATMNDALLKGGAIYETDEQTGERVLKPTKEQIDNIHSTVEKLLAENIFTKENINNGELNFSFETDEESIGYEFELEREQRINVSPDNIEIKEWKNYIVDVYDASGRCRIREKNGALRLSLKVPLFSKDSERWKCCIRLEFKPKGKGQEQELLKIRDLILEEPETQKYEKWGTPIKLTNGDKVWINKDEKDSYWIETDESHKIEDLLPDGISYLGHSKSKIKVRNEATERQASDFEKFKNNLDINLDSISRTAKGVSDTTVSDQKEKISLSGTELIDQVRSNQEKLVAYIWENSKQEINSEKDVEQIVRDLVGLINFKLNEDPYIFRTWPVKYGRRIEAEKIGEEMEDFYRNLFVKVKEAESGELDPKALGRWIELEFNRNIHPLADSCGRASLGISAFFLARFDHLFPLHDSRDEYYKAMNKGEDEFRKYYQKAFEKSSR